MKKAFLYVVFVLGISVAATGCVRTSPNTANNTGETGNSNVTIVNSGGNTFTGAGTGALAATGSLFYVLYEDGGENGEEIGCGDSLVEVKVALPQNVASVDEQLTRLYEQLIQGLFKPSEAATAVTSGLVIQEVKITGNSVRVDLTGTLMLGGTCDTPRVQEQLMRVALEFPGVDMAAVYMNGEILSSYLSLKE